MCGRGPVRLAIGVVLATLAWLTSCTYSPNPTSGLLYCGPGGACPKGYSCADGTKCWKDGASPNACSRTPTTAGDLVGTWTFGSGTVSTLCSDGSRDTRPLKDDFVDVFDGTTSDLIASFYCDWKVNFTGGKTALSPPAQTCMTTSNDTNFTWTGVTFEFASCNGKTATVDSKINAAYSNATGVGTCMLTITGALTLAP